MRKEFEEWVSWGKQKKRFLTFYKENVFDLTDFVRIHPGGRKSLDNYIYKDVTDLLFTVYPHKKETTMPALNQYIVGINASYDQKLKRQRENSKSMAKNSKSKKKVCFRNTVNYSTQKNRGVPKFQYHNDNTIDQNPAQIRRPVSTSLNIIDEAKKQNKHIIDRYEVSIKLISEQYIDLKQANMPLKVCEGTNSEQLDQNIKKQDIQQLKIVSRMPILKVKNLNK